MKTIRKKERGGWPHNPNSSEVAAWLPLSSVEGGRMAGSFFFLILFYQ
jgi:hypothetical protein